MKTLLTILLLAISVFAMPDTRCEDMYKQFIKVIPDQTTTICRAKNIGEDRTDVLGFFFKFRVEGVDYRAVLLYGSKYDDMLYAEPADHIATHAGCIEGNGYRKIQRKMTSAEIANKLLSHKDCEANFEMQHMLMTSEPWTM